MAIKRHYVVCCATLAALTCFSLPVDAGAIYYGTRAGLNAAANITLTEDFQSYPPGSNYTGPLTTPSGLTVKTHYPVSQDLYVAGPGQSSNPTTAMGVNQADYNSMWIGLNGYYTAFGVDVFQNFGEGNQGSTGQSVIYQAHLWSDSLGGYLGYYAWSSIMPYQVGFVGVTSDTAFNWVRIYSYAPSGSINTFEVVDNVAAGNKVTDDGGTLGGFGGIALPEPSALALFGMGAVGLICACGRRRRNG